MREILELAVLVKLPNGGHVRRQLFYCSEQPPTLETVKSLHWGLGEEVKAFAVVGTFREHLDSLDN